MGRIEDEDQGEGEYQRQRSMEDSIWGNMDNTGDKPSPGALAVARIMDEARNRKRDWHQQRNASEPRCGPNQWRCRGRMEVINIAKMGDGHLRNALRFAATKSQHSSRLGALTAEAARRSTRNA